MSLESAVSLLRIAAILLFPTLIIIHVRAARRETAALRRKYLHILAVAFFFTLFVPVLRLEGDGTVYVSTAYAGVLASLFPSGGDLTAIFILGSLVVAAHHVVCIVAAHLLTTHLPTNAVKAAMTTGWGMIIPLGPIVFFVLLATLA